MRWFGGKTWFLAKVPETRHLRTFFILSELFKSKFEMEFWPNQNQVDELKCPFQNRKMTGEWKQTHQKIGKFYIEGQIAKAILFCVGSKYKMMIDEKSHFSDTN